MRRGIFTSRIRRSQLMQFKNEAIIGSATNNLTLTNGLYLASGQARNLWVMVGRTKVRVLAMRIPKIKGKGEQFTC